MRWSAVSQPGASVRTLCGPFPLHSSSFVYLRLPLSPSPSFLLFRHEALTENSLYESDFLHFTKDEGHSTRPTPGYILKAVCMMFRLAYNVFDVCLAVLRHSVVGFLWYSEKPRSYYQVTFEFIPHVPKYRVFLRLLLSYLRWIRESLLVCCMSFTVS